MTFTFEDTKIIRDFEGHSLKAYKDGGGVWTISYGLTGKNIKEGLVITQEQSNKMFMDRINESVKTLESLVKKPLNKNQETALLSFMWNLGQGALKSSTLLKKININPNDPAISQEFLKWVQDNGKVVHGLQIRRAKESLLYNTK